VIRPFLCLECVGLGRGAPFRAPLEGFSQRLAQEVARQRGQLTTLRNEDAVRALGEDAFDGSPGPFFVSGQRRRIRGLDSCCKLRGFEAVLELTLEGGEVTADFQKIEFRKDRFFWLMLQEKFERSCD
jgi:hypothetical protein